MTVGDIDRSEEIWVYRPPKHKGAWRGHKKVVALGKPEQELIARYLLGKGPEQAVFSPKTALAEKWERDAERRKTPVTGVVLLIAGRDDPNVDEHRPAFRPLPFTLPTRRPGRTDKDQNLSALKVVLSDPPILLMEKRDFRRFLRYRLELFQNDFFEPFYCKHF